MKEKVYSVNNYWDMTIIEGMADFKGQPHYYTNIFSEKEDNWTDEYLLTPLSEDIFILSKEIWNYWLNWVETSNKTKVLHPVEYAKEREIKSFESLITDNVYFEEWVKAEKNHQNQFVFNHYLKVNKPIIKARGVFSGKIDGTETFVEWSEDSI